MSLATRLAGKISFAHLAGIGSRKSASAEGDEPEKKDDDEKAKAAAAESDEDKKPDAEGDKPDEKAEGSGAEDEPDGDEKKDAKAEHDEPDGDEDPDKEMRGNSPAAAARRRERARCAAIFGSKAAARNPVLAAKLAFNTSMSRTEALEVLEGSPAPASAAASDRAARNPQLGAGGSMQPDSKQAIQAGWAAAYSKYAPKR